VEEDSHHLSFGCQSFTSVLDSCPEKLLQLVRFTFTHEVVAGILPVTNQGCALRAPALVMSDAQREILESLAKSQTAAHREGSSAASVVRYGQLAVADVAAVASAAEAIDEVT
jgi:hypothetical protein